MELFLGMFSDDWERKRAAILHDRDRLRGHQDDEDEWLRSGSGGSRGDSVAGSVGLDRSRGSDIRGRSRYVASGLGASRPMAARLQAVAKGSQPAVVKLASYGGGGRAGAMLDYVAREGQIAVENERGETIKGQEGLKDVPGEWDHLMSGRAESRDVADFKLTIDGDHSALDDEAVHQIARRVVGAGLGDRRLAFAVSRGELGSLRVDGLTVLRSPSSGERLTADEKAEEIVQGRLDHALSQGNIAFSASISFGGYGNGVDYATAKLRDLVSGSEVPAMEEGGALIEDEAQAGDLVQKVWRHEMESRKARDVMHLIMSAREGTDVDAFRDASREFLAAEFGEKGFRYVFAVHDPKDDPKEEADGGKRPHVHAHAVVTMRSDFGDRIETSPKIFRDWRSSFAEKARAAGIEMEMTDRREFASAPAFTKNQVRPVSRSGRTEYEGTSPSADRRYRAKREGHAARAASTSRSEIYLKEVVNAWKEIAAKPQDMAIEKFAKNILQQIDRNRDSNSIEPHSHDKGTGSIVPVMVELTRLMREEFDMESSSRADFEAYEKRVETALFKAEKHVDDGNRAAFDDLAVSVRELVEARREQLELIEQRDAFSDRSESSDGAAGWDDYVTRHGLVLVVEGRDVLQDIENTREGIRQIEGSEPDDVRDELDRLKADLKASLREAARLAVEGNSFVMEMSERDPELKAEIAGHEERLVADGGRAASGQGPDDQSAELHGASGGDETRLTVEERNVFRQIAQTNEALDRRQKDRGERDSEPENTDERPSSESRETDPAKQQVPRLEELQREHDEHVALERERDRDDRDV